jgi:hypothetical protein
MPLCPLSPSLPATIENIHTVVFLELKSLNYDDIFGDIPSAAIQSNHWHAAFA